MKELFRKKFALILLLLTVSMLALGVFYLEKRIVITLIAASILLFIVVSYYIIYLARFKNIIDSKDKRQFYFKIYSFSSVFVFSILFLAAFALIGSSIDRISPDLGFGGVGLVAVLSHISQSVLNGLSFGFLSAFGFEYSTLTLKSILAISLVYLASSMICLSLFAALFARFKQRFEASKVVNELIYGEEINQENFVDLNSLKLKSINKRIRSGEIDLDIYGEDLVLLLINDQSKASRSVVLSIMEASDNMQLFTTCLDYFVTTKDRRLKSTCKRIESSEKQELMRLRGLISVGDNADKSKLLAEPLEIKSKNKAKKKDRHNNENQQDSSFQDSNLQQDVQESSHSEINLVETEYQEIPEKRKKNKNRKKNRNRSKHIDDSGETLMADAEVS